MNELLNWELLNDPETRNNGELDESDAESVSGGLRHV